MKNIHYKNATVPFLALLILCLGISLSACGKQTAEPTPTKTATAVQTKIPVLTATPRPSPTPTLPPLGNEGNPVILGFIISPEDTLRVQSTMDIALLLSEETGYALESRIFSDFTDLAEAIMYGEVHLAWLEPLEYLALSELGYADALLMSNHLGVHAYGVQFMVSEADGFRPYFDNETGESEGSMINALQQFAGTRPCFLNPDSLPGYYVPLGLLAQTSTPTLDPVFVYDYSAIIRAIYVDGICDFGVGYALIGNPLLAGDILRDIPDAQDAVEIIWQTDGVIPNTGLAASPNLPLTIQMRLQEAFMDLSTTTDELSLLTIALDYDVEALKTITDSYYNTLRGILAPLELDLQTITNLSQTNP